MRNEATLDSARTVIRPVIHPQNVTSPNVTDSSRGGASGGARAGKDQTGGSLTGALCTGFTLMPIPTANATGTRYFL